MVKPTTVKKEILDAEIEEWRQLLQDYQKMQFHDFPVSHDESVYQWLKTDDRHASSVTQVIKKDLAQDEPMNLRNDCFTVERRDTDLVPFWARIPTKQRHGGVWIPLEVPYRYYDILEEWEVKDSKLTKEDGEFWLHITVKTEVEEYDPDGVLAFDLGSRWTAVGVCGTDNKPLFIGKEIRTIRGKYQHLRRKTQQKGVDGFAEDKERRKVDYWLHTTTKWIAEYAQKNQLAVVVGDVSGVNGDTGNGRKMNRRVNTMVHHSFKEYLRYKCAEHGVPFEVVDESYTTQDCSRCGHREGRPSTKQFTCNECGLSMHADRNGAINIKQRGLDKLNCKPLSSSGAVLARPTTPEADIQYARQGK